MQSTGLIQGLVLYSRDVEQLLRLRMSPECIIKLKQLHQGIDLALTMNSSGEIIITLTPQNPESLLRS